MRKNIVKPYSQYVQCDEFYILCIPKFISSLSCLFSHEKYICSRRKCVFLSLTCKVVKDTLKAFDVFKNKQKSVWSNALWHVKVQIFWKCIQCTINCDKTQMLKN